MEHQYSGLFMTFLKSLFVRNGVVNVLVKVDSAVGELSESSLSLKLCNQISSAHVQHRHSIARYLNYLPLNIDVYDVFDRTDY